MWWFKYTWKCFYNHFFATRLFHKTKLKRSDRIINNITRNWYVPESYHYFSRLKPKPSSEFLLLLMSESTEVEVGEGACWGNGCWTSSLYEAEKCALATPTPKWWILRLLTWRGGDTATVCHCNRTFWIWCTTVRLPLLIFQLVSSRAGSGLIKNSCRKYN